MFALRAENVGKKYDLFRRPSDRLKQLLWPGKRRWSREGWALRNLFTPVRSVLVIPNPTWPKGRWRG